MILSFHPCFSGNKNILCAGREPDAKDLATIKAAAAVILPQGCTASLYQMARDNCPNVFPNYTARFKYRNKMGQILLFRETGTPHPDTLIHDHLSSFFAGSEGRKDSNPMPYPFVFKFDWGGEGDTVFLIRSREEFEPLLEKARGFEKTGHSGFLLQEYVPSQGRTLRVVVMYKKIITYWRAQADPDSFGSALSKGATIDADSDPLLQQEAAVLVKVFCEKTGIDLAGFDLMYSSRDRSFLFLEINYYFGRQGLGGSEKFYALLGKQIRAWIRDQGLSLRK